MTRYIEIAYALPTSADACHYGRPRTGCYVLDTRKPGGYPKRHSGPFATWREAQIAAAKTGLEIGPMSRPEPAAGHR